MNDLGLLRAFCVGGSSYFEHKFNLNEYDRGFCDALNMIIDHIDFCMMLKIKKEEREEK